MNSSIKPNMEALVAEKVYGTTDISERFGVSRQTAVNWVNGDEFPDKQLIGRSYVVPESNLLDFIDRQIEEYEQEIAKLQKIREEIKQGMNGAK